MRVPFKSAIFRQLRQIDLRRKYEDLTNFVKNIELDRSPVPSNIRRVAVLAPHPDDESLGCGGTIRQFAQQGAEVDVIFMTGGEYGIPYGETWTSEKGEALREVRHREAQAACRRLGVRDALFLGGVDTQLHRQSHLADSLAKLIKSKAYEIVFCPWPFDSHSDHVATFHLFQLAVQKETTHFAAWLYEVWNPLLANRFVNIDATLPIKLEAISQHESQSKVLDFKSKIVALSEYRSLSLPGSKHAEAFFVCSSQFIKTLRV